MTAQIKNWRENRAKRKHEEDLTNRLETIMYNIFDGLDTEESIEMFKNVHSLFLNRLEGRLIMAKEEENRIENFLS